MIITGAGPVGTVAAYALASQGIDVVVLEANDSCEDDLRASTIHSSTLSLLNRIGITDGLIEVGLKAPLFQYRIRATDEILEFDLGELDDVLEYPFRLQCEQYKLARMLAKKMEALVNADIQFKNEVTSFEQDTDGVTVFSRTPGGMRAYRGDFLIAADGASSSIRRQLKVDFAGFTYPEKFLTLSTGADLAVYFDDLCYVNYVSDPEDWFVLLKVPTAWRILVPVDESEDDEFTVSDEKKNALFRGLLGSEVEVNTNHRTIYRVHQRVVGRMNHNRVILAGDSAHLNNPLGGFGMNGGIHDALNLAQKLADVLKRNGDAQKLLGRYDRQRRTVMNEFVQAQTIRNKKMIEESGHASQRQQWDEMRAIHADKDRRRDYMLRQSMVHSLTVEADIA